MIRILIVCLVLGGCSVLDNVRKEIYMTEEEKEEAKIERFAEHREKCTELGFNPDDVTHTNCVLELEKSWIAAEAAQDAANSIWIHSSHHNR